MRRPKKEPQAKENDQVSNATHYPAPGEKLEDHPIAQIFPMMSGEEKAELAKSIKEHGQREPIVLLDGKILDGRNRWEACLSVGVEPKFRFYDYRKDGQSPTDYVLDTNLTRRQLTTSQRAAIAAEAMPFLKAEAKERQRISGQTHVGNIKPPAANEFDQSTAADPAEESQERKRGGTSIAAKPAAKAPAAPAKPAIASAQTEASPPTEIVKPAAPEESAGRAADIAADRAGVSSTLVKQALRIQAENPAGLVAIKSGESTVSAEVAKLSEERRKAQELADAHQRIENIAGKDLADAVRAGTRLKGRKEVLAFAALTDEQIIQTRGLIGDGWTVAKAIKYKLQTLSKTHRISDLITRAAANSGLFTLLMGEWEIMVRKKRDESGQ